MGRYIAIITVVFLAALGCSLSPSQNNPYRNPETDQNVLPQPQVEQPVPIILDTESPAPTPTINAEPTTTPTSPPAPTPTIKNHYYFNNFDSEIERPSNTTKEGIQVNYENGQLVIQVETSLNYLHYLLVILNQELTDAHISGQVIFEGDPTVSTGLFCRLKETANGNEYYAFLINKKGEYSVEYRVKDESDDRTEQTFAQGKTELLYPSGGMMNRLNAVCQGNKLFFFLNGELLAESTTKGELVSGYYGLVTTDTAGGQPIIANWDLIAITTP